MQVEKAIHPMIRHNDQLKQTSRKRDASVNPISSPQLPPSLPPSILPCAPGPILHRVELSIDRSKQAAGAPERIAAGAYSTGRSVAVAEIMRPPALRELASITSPVNGVVGRAIHLARRRIWVCLVPETKRQKQTNNQQTPGLGSHS